MARNVTRHGPMTDQELRSLIQGQIFNSTGYLGSQIVERRRKSMDYYLMEPFGDEKDGYSQAVLGEVSDTIEWLMPELMRIFWSSDHIGRFDPVGPEDQEYAEQATDYINHIIKNDNDGFLCFHNWFKDALLQINGIMKFWWDDSEVKRTRHYERISTKALEEVIMRYRQRDDVDEIIVKSIETYPNEQGVLTDMAHEFAVALGRDAQELELREELQANLVAMANAGDPNAETIIGDMISSQLHDVELELRGRKNRVCLEVVPPEDFGVSRRSRSLEEATIVWHRSRKRRGQLLEEGYPEDVVTTLPTHQEDVSSAERQARYDDSEVWGTDRQLGDFWTDEILVYECYLTLDYDGDGRPELRKCVVAGQDSLQILQKEDQEEPAEAIDGLPFADLTPIIVPHRWYGRSISDLVMDLQLIKSTVMRQWLDNTYQINNQRHVLSEDQANANTYDDWLTQRLGGAVRVDGDARSAVTAIPVQPIVQYFQPMLDYLDRVSEERTGVSRVSSGIDPDILQNTTATAYAAFQAKAQSRIEMIARIFADTGVRKLLTGIYELVSKYQQKPRMLRITNEWAMYDPTAWEDSADATVEIGLGFGSPERKYLMLEGVLNRQVQAIQGRTPLAGWHNVYNTLEKMVECTDLKHVEPYFEDPEKPTPQMQKFMQMQAQQGQQQPDPVMMGQLQLDQQKAQIEYMKLVAQVEKNRTDAALKGLDIRVDAEIEMMKIREQATEAAIDDEMRALETVGNIAVQSPSTSYGGMPGNGAGGGAQ